MKQLLWKVFRPQKKAAFGMCLFRSQVYVISYETEIQGDIVVEADQSLPKSLDEESRFKPDNELKVGASKLLL